MAEPEPNERERGRAADRPGQIPRRGWRDILLRVKDGIGADHVSIIAAGVAFYSLLAIFPAIAAVISIWGLLFDPAQIERQIAAVSGALPEQAVAILEAQARKVAGQAGDAISLALLGGLVLTLWSASRGVKALMEGLNVVYDERETRGFIKLSLTGLLLTLVLSVGAVVALGFVAVVPALLGRLGLGAVQELALAWLRWPVLFVAAMAGLGLLYRYGPSRHRARVAWVSWGAVLATVLWLVASIGFSIYVRYFGSYNEVYGSLGAVIILLMWLWLSAYIVLLGAELNAEMEHQTARDTTTGEPKPLGERGAYVADTVGEQR